METGLQHILQDLIPLRVDLHMIKSLLFILAIIIHNQYLLEDFDVFTRASQGCHSWLVSWGNLTCCCENNQHKIKSYSSSKFSLIWKNSSFIYKNIK